MDSRFKTTRFGGFVFRNAAPILFCADILAMGGSVAYIAIKARPDFTRHKLEPESHAHAKAEALKRAIGSEKRGDFERAAVEFAGFGMMYDAFRVAGNARTLNAVAE